MERLVRNMKNYGIDKRLKEEKRVYRHAKIKSWVKSNLPGKNQNWRRENYEYSFKKESGLGHNFHNGIPDDHFLKLEQIVTADLILREDIEKFKKGIIRLLKSYGGGSRFLPFYSTSFEETSKKIEQVDSTLISWFDNLKCGIFEFHRKKIHEVVDYFTLNIRNVNTSYLSVEFRIHITRKKLNELKTLINEDFHHYRGFAHKSLSYKKKGGAKDTFSMGYYTDDALKADRIYAWITCIEWEFYETIKNYLPIVLHCKGFVPPRIEVYYTDIDYRDDNRFFWYSVGVSSEKGQFIDESQKMFFETVGTGRFGSCHRHDMSRYLYIVKDDGIEEGQLKSVKDHAYFHMDDFAGEYFKFMFLNLMTKETAETIVAFKRKLDSIKLKKNRLNQLLKLRYEFERQIDPFIRYSRDDIWKRSIKMLGYEIYQYSDRIVKMAANPWVLTYDMVANRACTGADHINEQITVLRKEFDDKQQILQHLFDYKDSSRTMWMNTIMIVIAAATLFFVIFPERASWLAEIIRNNLFLFRM